MSPALRAAYTYALRPQPLNPMRPLPLLAALLTLAALVGCGTTTPLTLPPPPAASGAAAPAAAPTPTPAAASKPAEPRQ